VEAGISRAYHDRLNLLVGAHFQRRQSSNPCLSRDRAFAN
jgi:hypothetical protein